MSILVCGSLAYDTLLTFEGRFEEHILADQLHKISTTFLVPSMRREFGGCGGNIAFNLAMLGVEPLLMTTVGEDFSPYRAHLKRMGVNDKYVRTIRGEFTPQLFAISDRDKNQIMALHPGAMAHSHANHLSEVSEPIELAIVAPSGLSGALQHCEELAEAGIPFIFDPGQELPLFSAAQLRRLVGLATYVTLNDYESELMRDRAGLTIEAMRDMVDAVIVTRGSKGSEIHTRDALYEIPRVQMPNKPLDPLGCGDAYRAGLLFGIHNGLDWVVTGRLANILGAIKITALGPQSHFFDWDIITRLYQESYGEPWPLA